MTLSDAASIGRPSPWISLWMPARAAAAAPARLGEGPDEQALASAYARGLADGEAAARSTISALQTQLEALIASAAALSPPEPLPSAAVIAAAVSGAVRAIAGACPVDADLLAERATALLAMIDDAASATLHAHPDDIALLQPLALPVALVADPAARRGDLCLRGAATMIEDGVTTALDRFEDALLS